MPWQSRAARACSGVRGAGIVFIGVRSCSCGANYARIFVRVNIFAPNKLCLEVCSVVGAGDRLREERIALGLKQEEFAQLGGVNRNTQGSYEKGERNPDTAYLTAVAAVGVDVLYVITGARGSPALKDLSGAEAELVDKYRAISNEDRDAIDRIITAMAELATRRK
ncbi:XRE family transcriptional regulator [Pseudomonas sp. v388]|uniref:helix-turn-helix domain-containing protein n=1 Tax=Pseudomonas sp. v388 TaxID=2479849 RepID=UPI000F79320F|nr:helix-turn-helix transcriptional regulator [Pseudomonas sp. v388]RRV04611.1 XRE family transcriptional regulator [Pseudomonas sp. v388]